MQGQLLFLGRIAGLFVMGALLAACGSGSAEPSATPGPSAEAAAYLNEALDLIETNFIFLDQFDWPALRAEALERAVDAESTADTYATLRWVIDLAISAPLSFPGLVVMVLLAYTIFTTTLVLQRKEAGRGFALGLASLTVPAVPLLLLAGQPIAAAVVAVLAVVLFRGLLRPEVRAYLSEA